MERPRCSGMLRAVKWVPAHRLCILVSTCVSRLSTRLVWGKVHVWLGQAWVSPTLAHTCVYACVYVHVCIYVCMLDRPLTVNYKWAHSTLFHKDWMNAHVMCDGATAKLASELKEPQGAKVIVCSMHSNSLPDKSMLWIRWLCDKADYDSHYQLDYSHPAGIPLRASSQFERKL